MIFSKQTILKNIQEKTVSINPFNEGNLKDASYTFTLDTGENDFVEIESHGFIVLKTIEHLKLSPQVACLVSTRGFFAQQGIDVAQSSIFCEPDTDNIITLEVSNNSSKTITLKKADKIAKGVFVQVI